ncbi:MAG: hypothetical protein AAF333_06505 [Planctomycetota bacterium]
MRISFRSVASLCLVASCLAAVSVPAAAQIQKCNDTNGYVYGQYFVTAWTQNYNGWYCRTWDGNNNDQIWYLWINLQQNSTTQSAGFDAGVGRNESGGTRLTRMDDSDRINRGMYYKFTNGLIPQNGANYYMGPKTIVSTTQFYSGLNGQYECYIVDNSNLSPSAFANNYNLQYVSQGTYDGATYKHYSRQLGQINQVFSIRQNYRTQGWSSVNWIQRQWVLSGLVPGSAWNLGWKINIETAGKFANGSECGFTDLNLPWNNQ